MLISNDPETNERLCKPLATMTVLEYGVTYIESQITMLIERLMGFHDIKITSIAFVNGQAHVEWEDKA